MAERTGLAGWSVIMATWVGVIGAGWGGLEALAKYDEEIKHTADASVVQTFALYEMFNRSEMLDVRRRVNEATLLAPGLSDEEAGTSPPAQPAQAALLQVAAPGSAATAAERTGADVVEDAPESKISENDLVVFVDFFDAVQVCVERQLCDADLVDRLLKPYAVYNDLKTDIAKIRAAEKDLNLRHEFGSGIEWLDKTDLQALANKDK